MPDPVWTQPLAEVDRFCRSLHQQVDSLIRELLTTGATAFYLLSDRPCLGLEK
ncbi:hypothetical protein [Synechococcus elongatus]|uniref:hypothetical protein n=1 Tax=Synechococcus elongatus TaxID=32046 RepID=UPI00004601C5|nr:hypothetical protein [Synechococcus elongatus]WKW07016.1 hypothetical protein QY054_13795 [Synechococcus elongatus PCC 7942 = FACHB-805]